MENLSSVVDSDKATLSSFGIDSKTEKRLSLEAEFFTRCLMNSFIKDTISESRLPSEVGLLD